MNVLARICPAAAALALASCALAPADLERVHSGGHEVSPDEEAPLHALLEKALAAGPDTEEGSHYLGHFVERWRNSRGSEFSGDVPPGATEAALDDAVTYEVTFIPEGGGCYQLDYFDQLSPASDYRVRRMPHFKRDGLGAPLLGVRENRGDEEIERFYPPEAISRPVTALASVGPKRRSSGRESGTPFRQKVRVELFCPLGTDSVRRNGREEKLAADYSVSWAALLERTADLKRSRFTDAFLNTTPSRDPGLYLMQGYDPDKEPLIMIHGLFSTPLIWSELSNELWADDDIRGRYQIWHYLYNTSAPALYSGRILRTKLRELRAMLDPEGDDPAMQRTTVLAHSMGGIVTRSLIVTPEDAFWDAAFTVPIEDLTLSDEDRASLEEAFFWEAEPYVKDVIYVAVPHRGSDFADNPIGRLGKLAVAPPSGFKAFYRRISDANPGVFTQAFADLGSGKMDSVHALSPKRMTLQILPELPYAHPVRVHNIIGTKGQEPVEDSDDGLVPFWSSHLEDVDREVIVGTDHWIFQYPEGLKAIKESLMQLSQN